MADIQKLSELFTELEQDVTRLSKQQADITQSCMTLQAREDFLQAKITEQQQALEALKLAQDTNHATAEQAMQVAQAQVATIQKEIDVLVQKRADITSDIATLQVQQQTDIQDVADTLADLLLEITSKQAEKAGLDDTIARLQTEIIDSRKAAEVLDAQVTQKNSEVGTVVKELEQAERDAEARKAAIATQIDGLTAELDEKRTELQAAVSEADAAKKQHTDFMDYQTRATKALKAKEASLQERERQLEAARLRARRSGILDNI